jgi:tetratricopeptide (TPR) repeat protein
MVLAYQGQIDSARGQMKDAVLRARALRHIHTLTHVLDFACSLDLVFGEPPTHLDEFLSLASVHGMPLYSAFALQLRGAELIRRGQVQEALASVTQGLAEETRTGANVSNSSCIINIGRANTLLGNYDEARDRLAEAAQIINATGERVYEADVHRAWGDLRVATNDHAAAERHYRKSITVAQRQSARLHELQASTRLAELWRDQGRYADAGEMLRPIYIWFTEGLDTPVLKAAETLLAELA